MRTRTLDALAYQFAPVLCAGAPRRKSYVGGTNSVASIQSLRPLKPLRSKKLEHSLEEPCWPTRIETIHESMQRLTLSIVNGMATLGEAYDYS